jgi:hypothetical protein
MKKTINHIWVLTLSLTVLFTASQVRADGWDDSNDPSAFDNHYEYRFSALPLKAQLPTAQIPWSESYWPRQKGSINYRWNAPRRTGFNLSSPSKAQVLKMSKAELATLSPAEKYDLAKGLYDYPLTNYVDQVYASERAKEWEGVCDGWSASAIQFIEPKPVDFINPDGIAIPFGSSDVKGLMSYYAASEDLGSVLIGRYCARGANFFARSRCDDINPGTFHVILANEIGLKQKSFIADVDPGHQTWNQPVYGYEFTVVGSARSSQSSKAVRIHSKMFYTDELDVSQWNPVTGTEYFVSGVLEAEYILELNASGQIIGGEWMSGVHPDIFWKATKPIVFKGEAELINRIYQPM